MSSKRKHKRIKLTYKLRVFDASTDRLVGQIADITTEGLMLISEEPFETGATHKIWMELPSEMNEFRQISFDLKCIWSTIDTKTNLINSGFQILDAHSGCIELIERLIKDYEVTD